MEEDSGQEGGGEDRDLVRLQETPGDPWSPLESPEDPWSPLKTPEDPWRLLETPGDPRSLAFNSSSGTTGPGLAPDPGGPGISDPTDQLLLHYTNIITGTETLQHGGASWSSCVEITAAPHWPAACTVTQTLCLH